MTKIFLVSALVALLAMGCNANNQAENNLSGQSQSGENTTKTYSNSVFNFSVTIPEKNYAACETSRPVNTSENGDVIQIGSTFNCEGVEPNSFFGYTLYAGKNIYDQKSADAFVKKHTGPGCRATEWDRESGFLIDAISEENSSIEKAMSECPFVSAKYRVEYSPALKTAVFWSLSQTPELVDGKGEPVYLEDFKFNR